MAPPQPAIAKGRWGVSDELRVSEYRSVQGDVETGVYVRAKLPNGKWDSVDVSLLTASSLLRWLRSRGGDNPLAEDLVGIVLGYGRLHDSLKEEGT